MSTDQIDIENGERYDITFVDKDGSTHHPLILHCSPSGAIERVMYALLEKEAIKMKKGQKAMLPLWLSPTQMRFIPIGDDFISECEGYIKQLQGFSEYYQVRADIDDREHSVGRKIRDAEKEWIPVIVVVGEKEKSSNMFQPRFRDETFGENSKSFTIEQLHELIIERTKEYPQAMLPLPMHVSKRPKFK